jgi:hypothetical protein
LEVHEQKAQLAEPTAPEKQAACKIEAKPTSPEIPFNPADAQVVIDFSLLAGSAPFLPFEKVAPWN